MCSQFGSVLGVSNRRLLCDGAGLWDRACAASSTRIYAFDGRPDALRGGCGTVFRFGRVGLGRVGLGRVGLGRVGHVLVGHVLLRRAVCGETGTRNRLLCVHGTNSTRRIYKMWTFVYVYGLLASTLGLPALSGDGRHGYGSIQRCVNV